MSHRPRAPRGRGEWIDTLPHDLRTQYEREVLGDPRTTAEAARQWLLDRGCRVSLASILRHRIWLARDAERRARDARVAEATSRLAAHTLVTPEEMAAGRSLRSARQLFEQAYALFQTAYDGDELAAPDQVLAVARVLRAMVQPPRTPKATVAFSRICGQNPPSSTSAPARS